MDGEMEWCQENTEVSCAVTATHYTAQLPEWCPLATGHFLCATQCYKFVLNSAPFGFISKLPGPMCCSVQAEGEGYCMIW